MIDHIEKLTSRVDNKSYNVYNYVTSIREWINIKKAHNDADPIYQKRIDTLTQNLILEEVMDILCPTKLLLNFTKTDPYRVMT